MISTVKRPIHPQADRDCRECGGSGYARKQPDPFEPAPITEVCGCVLRRLEQGGERKVMRHGRRS